MPVEQDIISDSFAFLRDEITRRGAGPYRGIEKWMRAGSFLMGTGLSEADILVIEDTTPDSMVMQESVTLYRDASIATGIDPRFRFEALETYEGAFRHSVYAKNTLHIPQTTPDEIGPNRRRGIEGLLQRAVTVVQTTPGSGRPRG